MKKHSLDIVIPLGSGSQHDNFELRMALRSIDKYALNCKNVYIVTANLPQWLENVIHINIADTHRHNKDANIIDKLLAAADRPELSDEFIFWSDDQLALQRFYLHTLPTIYNPRQRRDFNADKIWHRRMRNTFDYLDRHHKKLNCNFESHTPQKFNKQKFINLFRAVDYAKIPGFCINTLYFGMLGTEGKLEQKLLKATYENASGTDSLPADMLFLGYNDNALSGNLKNLLEARFPEPCRYEKTL